MVLLFYLELNKKVLIDEDDLMPLYDDLNTPGYISVLHKLFDKAKSGSQEDKEKFVAGCNFVGLLEENKEDWLSFKKSNMKVSEEEINILIDKRNDAREH